MNCHWSDYSNLFQSGEDLVLYSIKQNSFKQNNHSWEALRKWRSYFENGVVCLLIWIVTSLSGRLALLSCVLPNSYCITWGQWKKKQSHRVFLRTILKVKGVITSETLKRLIKVIPIFEKWTNAVGVCSQWHTKLQIQTQQVVLHLKVKRIRW